MKLCSCSGRVCVSGVHLFRCTYTEDGVFAFTDKRERASSRANGGYEKDTAAYQLNAVRRKRVEYVIKIASLAKLRIKYQFHWQQRRYWQCGAAHNVGRKCGLSSHINRTYRRPFRHSECVSDLMVCQACSRERVRGNAERAYS